MSFVVVCSSFMAVIIFMGCALPRRDIHYEGVTVYPGYGVSNVCVLGMTQKQFLNAATISHVIKRRGSSFYGVLPLVGAVANIESKRVVAIIFYLREYQDSRFPGVNISSPFVGRLAPGITFTGEPVSRKELEKYFGIVTNCAQDLREVIPFVLAAESYCLMRPGGEAISLDYPNGIRFIIVSNEVVSFDIVHPWPM